MKTSILSILFALFVLTVKAQTATYILVRHAEKDTTQQSLTMMASNPPLSKLGIERSLRLITALQAYAIDSIYSTNYIRTVSTTKPIADKFNIAIQHYNPLQLTNFAHQLLQTNNKTFLIIGHSNTTPTLLNVLSKSNNFKPLDENVYNLIYVITIKNGETFIEIMEY